MYLDLSLNWPDPLLLPSLPTQLHVLLPTLKKEKENSKRKTKKIKKPEIKTKNQQQKENR